MTGDSGIAAASAVLSTLAREDRRQKLLASARYRDLVLAVALGADLLLLRMGYARPSPIFFGALAALWVWNRIVARLYRHDRGTVALPLVSGVLDVAVITLLVGETGGLRSALLPLYFAIAAGAVAHAGARAGGFVLLLSGLALALLALPQASAYAASRGVHGWPDPIADPRYRLVIAAAFVASLAPVLFTSAHLARETRARERRLASANASLHALWEIGRELSDTLSSDRVIETTLREMRDRFGMARADLFLLSPEGKLAGVSEAHPAASAEHDASALRARLDGSDPVQEGARLYLPLRAKGRVMGLLVAEQPPPGRPLDPGELTTLASLATQTGIALDNARLYEAKEQLSRTDGLTQLYNHRFFQERIPEEIKRSDRFRQKLSLVMLDVDDFKRINDSFGHPIGDQVLRRVARIARDCLREVDVPARYGGDEFAIILPDTDLGDAIEVAERLRREVEKRPVLFEGAPVALTISLGVATRPPQSTLSSEELLKMADQALLSAKRSGRNTVASFLPSSDFPTSS